ncbi:hypothetical protein F4819DRAFT_470958 [Hypoxylon fuscum]|nr:hypothetical protein F4819DRAFT_470958 [Hypoxylon fuscum]
MDVSLVQAMQWENPVAAHFANERTKDWKTRLREYWARQNGLSVAGESVDELEHCRKERIGIEFYGFTSLPREIRDNIYKYLLVKGTVFLPNHYYSTTRCLGCPIDATRTHTGKTYERYKGIPADWDDCEVERRSIALISGVSKAIQDEAEAIYFGYNRFVWPYWSNTVNYAHRYSSNPRQEKRLCLMRDISVTFDMRETTVDTRTASQTIGPIADLRFNSNESNSIYKQKIHGQFQHSLKLEWRKIAEVALCFMKLNRLQISFEDCYCPLGCCRLFEEALNLVIAVIRRSEHPDKGPRFIEICGWNDQDEKEAAAKIMENGLALADRATTKVEFIGKSMKEVYNE